MNNKRAVLAIVGGTGGLGTGLARRWVQAGFKVIIGSRTQEKANAMANELLQVMAERGVEPVDVEAKENAAAAAAADVVVFTVPFAYQRATLESIRDHIQGKILIDTTVPLVPPRVARVQMPERGSAGLLAQDIVGEEVDVVSAFQNVAAFHLQEGQELGCDVLVCGNSKEARSQVVELIEAIGMRGVHAGSLANSAATEAMTSLIIFINKQHKCHAGLAITGLDK